VARAFKVKLLTKFVNQTAADMYCEAVKVDMITAVHKLRLISRLFPAGTQVFRPEPSDLKENGCYHYPAPQVAETTSFTLPSTQTILETPVQKQTPQVDLLKEDPLNLEPE
jgi:hypothetical protein